MEEKKIAEYFIVAGLSANPQPLDEYSDETSIKSTYNQDPIVDIAVINKTLGENAPDGYKCVEFTPNGFPADLNHGSLRAHEMNICYKRGREKPPLMDIGYTEFYYLSYYNSALLFCLISQLKSLIRSAHTFSPFVICAIFLVCIVNEFSASAFY